MLEKASEQMIKEITNLVNETKSKLRSENNNSIIYVYWNIGRIIVSNENEHNNRLEYGKEVLKGLSRKLTKYLGKGFMYVGSQQRITLNNTSYYIDMVFYNKFLKSYVLIDLKMNNLKAENLGQMNLYLNYYEKVVNEENDNKPIGIILCTEKDNIMMEFSLGGISNNLFASTYTYYIPGKDELISEVEKVLKDTSN